ncbi:MAG: RNA ligase family protein [Trueperaceae bacterium]
MSTSYYKYPRTPHLPWSPGVSEDDLLLSDSFMFEGQEVIVTEKLDGENTSMYSDHIHARSLDSRQHPSRTWVKAFHGTIAHLIPAGWRLCGENMYARHSISYETLKSYFYIFSIWNEKNVCLSWQETKEWAELLGLELPPILYQGQWYESNIHAITLNLETQEGYVVRNTESFAYVDFQKHVAKWVRKNHVQTDQHWMHSEVIPNGLVSE